LGPSARSCASHWLFLSLVYWQTLMLIVPCPTSSPLQYVHSTHCLKYNKCVHTRHFRSLKDVVPLFSFVSTKTNLNYAFFLHLPLIDCDKWVNNESRMDKGCHEAAYEGMSKRKHKLFFMTFRPSIQCDPLSFIFLNSSLTCL
jgi:hypothetical protein